MKPEKIFHENRHVILLLTIVICFATLFLPFLNVITASVVTAYFSYPLFQKLHKKLNTFLSMMITWIVIFLIIIVPVGLISSVTYSQVQTIIKDTQNSKIVDIKSLESNKYFKWVENYVSKNEESVAEIELAITDKVKGVGEAMVGQVGNFIKNFPFLIIKIILYIFITSSLIINGIQIKHIIKNLSPIDGKTFDIFTEKIKHMTNGIMVGNFIIAAIQALTTTISFMLAGIPYAGIVFMISFLLYIPMIGTAILYIPATIFLIIQGNYLAAILVFLWNSVAVANIDNIFRGKFVSKEAEINNTLMFISVLSGVLLFGVMGVLYGPLIAVIGVTAIKLYLQLKKKK